MKKGLAVISALLVLSQSGDVTAQELKSQEPAVVLKGHADGILFMPDGKQMVTCGQDGTIKFWDTQTWKVAKLHDTKVSQWKLTLSPDGSTLITDAGNGHLWALDVPSQKFSVLFDENAGERVISAVFSSDSKYLFVSRSGGMFQYWTLKLDKGVISKRLVFNARLDRDMVGLLGLAEGGKSLVIAGSERTEGSILFSNQRLNLWDIEGKKVKRKIETPEGIGSLGNVMSRVINSDKLLFTLPGCAGIGILDIARNKAIPPIKTDLGPEPRSVWAAEASPDGKTIAVAEFVSFEGERGLVRIIDLETRQVIRRLRSNIVPFRLAFSPDGNTLACGCSSVVQIFDLSAMKRK